MHSKELVKAIKRLPSDKSSFARCAPGVAAFAGQVTLIAAAGVELLVLFVWLGC
jgi:hypothetical protein